MTTTWSPVDEHIVQRICWNWRNELSVFIGRDPDLGKHRDARHRHAGRVYQHCAYCLRDNRDTPEELQFVTCAGEQKQRTNV